LGTRVQLLEEIQSWAAESTSRPIFWLHDSAGAGKSTVAHQLVCDWNKAGCLGGSLFFSFQNAGLNQENFSLFLAKQMIHLTPSLKKDMESAWDSSGLLSGSVQEHFQILITNPILKQNAKEWGNPKIVVLDALDECIKREMLLKILLEEAPKLASFIRFFVTSCPEHDIQKSLGCVAAVRQKSMLDDSGNKQDIHRYVTFSLKKDFNGQPTPFEIQDIQNVVDHSNGLFLWDSTACETLHNYNCPEEELLGLLDLPLGNTENLLWIRGFC